MKNVYLSNPQTGEYTGFRELTGNDKNPKFTPQTHAPEDEYILDPRVETFTKPMDAGENETQYRTPDAGSKWTLVPDFRGRAYWHTATKASHTITELNVAPPADWTDQEPKAWQTWDGEAWADDLRLWLDIIVRPERDNKMNAFEWRCARHEREIRLGQPTTDNIADLDAYMQALADLPASLTTVTDSIPWPQEP